MRSRTIVCWALGAAALASSGCAHLTHIEQACGSPPHDSVCLGDIVVPRSKGDAFDEGAKAAVDAVYSERLREDLRRFIATHAGEPSLEEAWRGADADRIVDGLRRAIAGTQISTFGGPRGLSYYVLSGTVAFERANDDAPIQVNRWGLASRTSAQLANTIVHEVAHATGLRHPHMGGPLPNDARISACEPPYLIGSLAERIAAGATWRWTSYHCEYLK